MLLPIKAGERVMGTKTGGGVLEKWLSVTPGASVTYMGCEPVKRGGRKLGTR